MKRIHLFEFEDFHWFPSWIRNGMTAYIKVIHQAFGTVENLKPLIMRLLEKSSGNEIVDLCSGSGGPMIEVAQKLRAEGLDFDLTLTDLYPNQKLVSQNELQKEYRYEPSPVDATKVNLKGARTMICSMHHMRPEMARKILGDAYQSKEPICVLEISDNSLPLPLAVLAFPIGILMVLFFTLKIRPVSWTQIVLTYLIPIYPILISWDGMVSNLRTYTLEDLDELLNGLEGSGYLWEKGLLKVKGGNMIYLLGLPSS